MYFLKCVIDSFKGLSGLSKKVKSKNFIAENRAQRKNLIKYAMYFMKSGAFLLFFFILFQVRRV